MSDTINKAEDQKVQLGKQELEARLEFASTALTMDSIARLALYGAISGADPGDHVVIGASTDSAGVKGAYIIESHDLPYETPFKAMTPGQYAELIENFPVGVFPVRAYLIVDNQRFDRHMFEMASHIVNEHMIPGTPEYGERQYANWPLPTYVPKGDLSQPRIEHVEEWASIHGLLAIPRAESFILPHLKKIGFTGHGVTPGYLKKTG